MAIQFMTATEATAMLALAQGHIGYMQPRIVQRDGAHAPMLFVDMHGAHGYFQTAEDAEAFILHNSEKVGGAHVPMTRALCRRGDLHNTRADAWADYCTFGGALKADIYETCYRRYHLYCLVTGLLELPL